MRSVLQKKFFDRPALVVAEDLLGKYLVRKQSGKEHAFKIIETEAYTGPHDKACHAFKGRTPRTDVMYKEPGTLYIYFVYGMYHMLNIVVEKEGYPAAVLIRGVETISGPGRLTRDLHITKKENGKEAHPDTRLWFEDRGEKVSKKHIKKTPRIGISYAQEWRDKPYRFVLEN